MLTHEGRERNSTRAFTLLELIAAMAVAGVLTALAVPGYQRIMANNHGVRCGANIILIENAKNAWVADNPGVALSSTNNLLPYLPYGFPSCPAGGTYGNVTDLYSHVTCSADNGVIDGLHDYGKP